MINTRKSNKISSRRVAGSSHIQTGDVKIIDYKPEYSSAFKSLNEEWITKHWEIESADQKVLDDPQSHIIDKGGAILIALHNEEPVGCCALIRINNSEFELAKMAVSSNTRGKGIGYLLGMAIVNRASLLGASRICLESNSMLKAAIQLYQKLGFHQIERAQSPYKRCDIRMEKSLHSK